MRGRKLAATTTFELETSTNSFRSESTSIPKNPRTDRPVGYAFVDLSTPTEADRAIQELSGKEILERKVSVQLARKPEPAGEKKEGEQQSGGEGASGAEGGRRRQSGRGRGRGRGRGGRAARAGEHVSDTPIIAGPPNALIDSLLQWLDSQLSLIFFNHLCHFDSIYSNVKQQQGDLKDGEVLPLQDITNEAANKDQKDEKKPARAPRERRERGPPADGVPSKNKVMVANLPYDLSEEKVSFATSEDKRYLLTIDS